MLDYIAIQDFTNYSESIYIRKFGFLFTSFRFPIQVQSTDNYHLKEEGTKKQTFSFFHHSINFVFNFIRRFFMTITILTTFNIIRPQRCYWYYWLKLKFNKHKQIIFLLQVFSLSYKQGTVKGSLWNTPNNILPTQVHYIAFWNVDYNASNDIPIKYTSKYSPLLFLLNAQTTNRQCFIIYYLH